MTGSLESLISRESKDLNLYNIHYTESSFVFCWRLYLLSFPEYLPYIQEVYMLFNSLKISHRQNLLFVCLLLLCLLLHWILANNLEW